MVMLYQFLLHPLDFETYLHTTYPGDCCIFQVKEQPTPNSQISNPHPLPIWPLYLTHFSSVPPTPAPALVDQVVMCCCLCVSVRMSAPVATQLILHSTDSVEVAYSDGSSLQLSPCATAFRYYHPRGPEVHPLQGNKWLFLYFFSFFFKFGGWTHYGTPRPSLLLITLCWFPCISWLASDWSSSLHVFADEPMVGFTLTWWVKSLWVSTSAIQFWWGSAEFPIFFKIC